MNLFSEANAALTLLPKGLLSKRKISQWLKITQKSLIQHCERSELRLHFEWTKVNQKCQKWSIWQFFENLNLRSNSVPDKSILNGQKLVENAIIKKN